MGNWSFLTGKPSFPDYSESSRRLWLSEIPCWKGVPANFDAAGKFFTDFPAARNAIPAKVWAFSGKENGCLKIGRAFGNAAGFSPPRPPQPSWVLLNYGDFDPCRGRTRSQFQSFNLRGERGIDPPPPRPPASACRMSPSVKSDKLTVVGFACGSGMSHSGATSWMADWFLTINSFHGPLLGFKTSRSRGKDEKLRQEKAKMRKKTKHWNVKSPHTKCVCVCVGVRVFYYEAGEKLNFWLFWAHWLRLMPDFYMPPVLGGAVLFDNSAAAVYKNLVNVPKGPWILYTAGAELSKRAAPPSTWGVYKNQSPILNGSRTNRWNQITGKRNSRTSTGYPRKFLWGKNHPYEWFCLFSRKIIWTSRLVTRK